MTQPPLPTLVRGAGDPVVLLHGFAMVPATYARTIAELALRARVLMPMWLYVEGPWSYEGALEGLDAILETLEIERATLIGHSAGGAIALGYAAHRPERTGQLVLVDTLGASDARRMRRSAVPGPHLARLASLAATRDFFGTVFTRPRDLGRAAMWAYRHVPAPEIASVRRTPMDRHVIWSATDVLLPPADGARFAEELEATFTVVEDPGGEGGVDHDWVYRHPRLFTETLERLRIVPEAAR